MDAALKVGAVTEQVTVEANATLVETRNSGVSTVIESERIQPQRILAFGAVFADSWVNPWFPPFWRNRTR